MKTAWAAKRRHQLRGHIEPTAHRNRSSSPPRRRSVMGPATHDTRMRLEKGITLRREIDQLVNDVPLAEVAVSTAMACVNRNRFQYDTLTPTCVCPLSYRLYLRQSSESRACLIASFGKAAYRVLMYRDATLLRCTYTSSSDIAHGKSDSTA